MYICMHMRTPAGLVMLYLCTIIIIDHMHDNCTKAVNHACINCQYAALIDEL